LPELTESQKLTVAKRVQDRLQFAFRQGGAAARMQAIAPETVDALQWERLLKIFKEVIE
jgi:hypothetical protein